MALEQPTMSALPSKTIKMDAQDRRDVDYVQE